MQHKGLSLSAITLAGLISVGSCFAINSDLDHGISCGGAAVGGRIVSYVLDQNGITKTKTQALAAGATVSLLAIIARRAEQISNGTIGIGGICGDLFFTAVGYALTTVIVPIQDKDQNGLRSSRH